MSLENHALFSLKRSHLGERRKGVVSERPQASAQVPGGAEEDVTSLLFGLGGVIHSPGDKNPKQQERAG